MATVAGRGSELGYVRIRYKLPKSDISRLISTPIDGRFEVRRFEEAPQDARFAIGVAAFAEMLRGGITCFNDMYFFPQAALESALEAGMRSAHGIIVIEFPSAYAADAADYLRKGLEVRDRYGDEPLASFCLAPHAPYTVANATFRHVATLAAESRQSEPVQQLLCPTLKSGTP